jgi:hypothetical protein
MRAGPPVLRRPSNRVATINAANAWSKFMISLSEPTTGQTRAGRVGEWVGAGQRQCRRSGLWRAENHRTGLQIRYGGGAGVISIPYGRPCAVFPAAMPESGRGRWRSTDESGRWDRLSPYTPSRPFGSPVLARRKPSVGSPM